MAVRRRDFVQLSSAAGVLMMLGNPGTEAEAQGQSANIPAAGGRAVSGAHQAAPVTQYVCQFVSGTPYSSLPTDVLELGKKSILDGIGLALAGSVAETGELTHKYLEHSGFVAEQSSTNSSGSATVIGSRIKAPVRFAAFVNGVSIHAEDYDDTQLAVAPDRVYGLLTHPTAPVLPVALALAETRGVSGRDFTVAYHIGIEVACKVAESINPRHYQDGFHSTGTLGTIGAAAAASRLYGFETGAIARAMGIAAAQASGLRPNFGTMTKPFHAGRAAESGVVAAEFAALGWTASENILEAPQGFYQAAGGGFDAGAIMGMLGKPWTFADPGISIKPHPCGSLTHPGMTEMRRLIQEHKIRAEQVERVDVGTNSNMPKALIHHQPKNALQAKFSMEFGMAALLLYGKAGLIEFQDEVVNRPEVKQMIQRVHFGVNEEAERAGYNKMTTIIDIQMKDGRKISGRADFGKGSPANPMSYSEVADKFLDCAAFAKWPSQKSRAIVEMVRKLEDVKDIRQLTALCSA
ncbi:MAG: MmgE/PrpD family protein [Candidatus Korobacteraceae bacterium]